MPTRTVIFGAAVFTALAGSCASYLRFMETKKLPESSPRAAPVFATSTEQARLSALFMPRISAWAAQANAKQLDCPMPPNEAKALMMEARGAGDGMYRDLALDVGCMCSVTWRASKPERVLNAGTLCEISESQVNDFSAAPEDPQVGQWLNRLRQKNRANPSEFVRARKLDLAVDFTGMTAEEEADTRSFIGLKERVQNINDLANAKSFDGMPERVAQLEEALRHHERVTLNGKPSVAGRALVAQMKDLQRSSKTIIAKQQAAQRALDANPEYARLQRERELLDDKIRTYMRANRISDDVSPCGSTYPTLCNLSRRKDKVEDRLAMLEKSAGFEN